MEGVGCPTPTHCPLLLYRGQGGRPQPPAAERPWVATRRRPLGAARGELSEGTKGPVRPSSCWECGRKGQEDAALWGPASQRQGDRGCRLRARPEGPSRPRARRQWEKAELCGSVTTLVRGLSVWNSCFVSMQVLGTPVLSRRTGPRGSDLELSACPQRAKGTVPSTARGGGPLPHPPCAAPCSPPPLPTPGVTAAAGHRRTHRHRLRPQPGPHSGYPGSPSR